MTTMTTEMTTEILQKKINPLRQVWWDFRNGLIDQKKLELECAYEALNHLSDYRYQLLPELSAEARDYSRLSGKARAAAEQDDPDGWHKTAHRASVELARRSSIAAANHSHGYWAQEWRRILAADPAGEAFADRWTVVIAEYTQAGL